MASDIFYDSIKIKNLFGRYITLDDVRPELEKFQKGQVSTIGKSVLDDNILLYKVGEGEKKILLWSQMHGNESTTTKALIDFLSFLENESAAEILKDFTFYAILLLNPDGAKSYTRNNANDVDLNRDFQNLTQPESRILDDLFRKVKPDLCFNLHDQRSIFGVGNPPKPATISFLAPAFNEARDYNKTRNNAISIIVKMIKKLETEIPNQIGRFDDSFNPNCVGDAFQMKNCPTILIEAGHFDKDYDREFTRQLIFNCLTAAFESSNENDVVCNNLDFYLNIPQNNIDFYDFVYRNVKINYDSSEIITNFAAQLEGRILQGKFQMVAIISDLNFLGKSGHVEYDCKSKTFQNIGNKAPQIGDLANFNIGEDTFVNGAKI